MILGVWLLAWVLFLPPQIQAQAPVPPAARELSHAFTNAARQALPAVVFITAETLSPTRLGFKVQNLTPELAQQLGYDDTEGVVVTEIDPRSEAYQAGVRRGMVIREINHQEVSNTQKFRQAVEQAEQSKQMLLLV